MNSGLLNDIKAEASSLGFFSCGVAQASVVEDSHAKVFLDMIERGDFATMDYLARNIDKRLDPRLLLEGADTLICVALNYTPSITMNPDGYLIAQYAYGKDYHDVMKERLYALAKALNLQNFRVFCDTAPVLERYWAQKAGLGWIGKNHQLIIPKAGSRVFLGEILCSMPKMWEEAGLSPSLPTREGAEREEDSADIGLKPYAELYRPYGAKANAKCGSCTKCQEACPTQVFKEEGWFNCNRCLSYHTIENHGEIPEEIAQAIASANAIYGCDRCLLACPFNQNTEPTNVADFQLTPYLYNMTKEDWQNLTEEEFRKLFKGSAVKRTKYAGLVRNIKIISK